MPFQRRNKIIAAIAAPLIALILAVSPVHADQHLAASTEFVQDLADRAVNTLTAHLPTVAELYLERSLTDVTVEAVSLECCHWVSSRNSR